MVKVAFIICYNDDIYMRECMDYISWLRVPNGVETEIIGITEAESMAAGYNAAMHSSDAKYKVYLHQDVFILNENMIQEMIDIFEKYPEYGMLGVIGSTKAVSDANYWLSWDIGCTDAKNSLSQFHIRISNPDEIEEVKAIDGMFMATQYDVEWREDLFDGFDFYDISQSMEFQRKGYKVGIPHQNRIWCNHVSGSSKLKDYEIYRKKFCEEYGYSYSEDSVIKDRIFKQKEIERCLPEIQQELINKNIDNMTELITKAMDYCVYNTNLCDLYVINRIMRLENKNNITHGFYRNTDSVAELMEKYKLYRLVLSRLEYEKPIENITHILEQMMEEYIQDFWGIREIAKHITVATDRVMSRLKWEIEKRYQIELKTRMNDKPFCIPGQEEIDTAELICKKIQDVLDHYLSIKTNPGSANVEPDALKNILELIENVSDCGNIRKIDDELYMSYFDAMTDGKKISYFLEQCQKWNDGVTHYINGRESNPIVTVLVSVYNGELFIEDTLRSVMDQSYHNMQIIVIDDCSKDKSRKVIERMAEIDQRIEPIYMEYNSNVCKAINTGYEKAKGKYIAVIGHDDIWKKDKIEKQVQFMEMYPEYAACFTLVDIIDDDKEICNQRALDLYTIFDQRNRTHKEWVETLFLNTNVLCAPSVLIRRSCIKRKYMYVFGLVQLQDMELWLELLKDSSIYILQERLMLYRKFFKKESNLSAYNDITRNRLRHEISYIHISYLSNLTDEQLLFLLKDHFRDKTAETEAELKCERAFIMLELGDLHCIDMFIDLYEDDETRSLLEEKYNFRLKDFYELNSKSYSYDLERDYQLLEVNQRLKQTVDIVQKQQHVIEEQQMLIEKIQTK